MIGGMVREKAVAPGAGADHQPYLSQQRRFVAGTNALNGFFKQIRARQIGEGHRGKKGQRPPESLGAVIEQDKSEDKKIKRRPEQRVAEEGQDGIKKGIRQAIVQHQKQASVPILQPLPKRDRQFITGHWAKISLRL